MVIPKINSAHGSDTRNIINRTIDSVNVQGKSIQDLVAEGQLTEQQYADLIASINGFLKSGQVSKLDLSGGFKSDLEFYDRSISEAKSDINFLLQKQGGNTSKLLETFSNSGTRRIDLKYIANYLTVLNLGVSDMEVIAKNPVTGKTQPKIIIPSGLGYGSFFEEFTSLNVNTGSSYFIETKGSGETASYMNNFIKNNDDVSVSSSAGFKGSTFTTKFKLNLEEVHIIGDADRWELWTVESTNIIGEKVGEGILSESRGGYSVGVPTSSLTLSKNKEYALFGEYSKIGEATFSDNQSNINTEGLITPHRKSRNTQPVATVSMSPETWAFDYKIVVKEVM